MRRGEEFAPELGQHRSQIVQRRVTLLEEGADTAEAFVDPPQRHDEITQIAAVEGAVGKGRQSVQFAIRGVAHEIGRGVVHQEHHPVAVAHDRRPVAPRNRRRKKAGNLPVGTLREAVRHRNRIVLDEFRTVIAVVELLEKLLQFGLCHHS